MPRHLLPAQLLLGQILSTPGWACQAYGYSIDSSVNFQAPQRPAASTGMKAANTHTAATLAAPTETPAARPQRLATMPATAVPTA